MAPSTKRFRTLRTWHNTLLMVWGVPFLLLPGVIVGAFSGRFDLLWGLAAFCTVGLVVAARRDRFQECYYTLTGEVLGLVRNKEHRELKVEDIIDSSLIDRSSARGYIRQWCETRRYEKSIAREHVARFTRYCTMDIGFTSFTMGMGRTLIDRLPSAKKDMVLVRVKGDEGLLLSPANSQDLVDSLSRRKLQLVPDQL